MRHDFKNLEDENIEVINDLLNEVDVFDRYTEE